MSPRLLFLTDCLVDSERAHLSFSLVRISAGARASSPRFLRKSVYKRKRPVQGLEEPSMPVFRFYIYTAIRATAGRAFRSLRIKFRCSSPIAGRHGIARAALAGGV